MRNYFRWIMIVESIYLKLKLIKNIINSRRLFPVNRFQNWFDHWFFIQIKFSNNFSKDLVNFKWGLKYTSVFARVFPNFVILVNIQSENLHSSRKSKVLKIALHPTSFKVSLRYRWVSQFSRKNKITTKCQFRNRRSSF